MVSWGIIFLCTLSCRTAHHSNKLCGIAFGSVIEWQHLNGHSPKICLGEWWSWLPNLIVQGHKPFLLFRRWQNCPVNESQSWNCDQVLRGLSRRDATGAVVYQMSWEHHFRNNFRLIVLRLSVHNREWCYFGERGLRNTSRLNPSPSQKLIGSSLFQRPMAEKKDDRRLYEVWLCVGGLLEWCLSTWQPVYGIGSEAVTWSNVCWVKTVEKIVHSA